MKLKCDYQKVVKLLGWKPEYTLEQGIQETEDWITKKF
jgi:nucleoside-diphosphate-sugar epimerase